jgi:hypothetical protein
MPKNKVNDPITGPHRPNPDREKVLARLWEIANLSPEMTRHSVTGQVKALSIIVAMENYIPDRRAISAEKKSAPAPTPKIYQSAWLPKQQATTNDPQPSPAPAIDLSSRPERSEVEGPAVSPGPSQSTPANRPSEAPKPHVPLFGSVPDLGPFSLKKSPFNPFVRPR